MTEYSGTMLSVYVATDTAFTHQERGTKRVAVACGSCPWRSRRLPGNVVWCPKCGNLAAFQMENTQ